MEDKILKKTKNMYERDPSKGPYQGVTPFVSHGVQTGGVHNFRIKVVVR